MNIWRCISMEGIPYLEHYPLFHRKLTPFCCILLHCAGLGFKHRLGLLNELIYSLVWCHWQTPGISSWNWLTAVLVSDALFLRSETQSQSLTILQNGNFTMKYGWRTYYHVQCRCIPTRNPYKSLAIIFQRVSLWFSVGAMASKMVQWCGLSFFLLDTIPIIRIIWHSAKDDSNMYTF